MFPRQIYRFKNESKTMKEWVKKYRDRGLTIDTLRARWKVGKRGDELFEALLGQDERNTYCAFITYDIGNGEETKTIKEWAEELGMNPKTLAARYGRGQRDPKILLRPRFAHTSKTK